MAVIGQASHQLAEHITVRGAVEFAIIFGLSWFAWINGSLYVELHGGEDGRTRNIVFVQMCILALLAVFTADAADRDGTPFSGGFGDSTFEPTFRLRPRPDRKRRTHVGCACCRSASAGRRSRNSAHLSLGG